MGRRDKRWKCGLALRMMLFGVTAGATDLLRGPRRIRCQSRHSRAALCHPAAGSWIHFKGLEVTGVQVTITADDFASLDESLLPPIPVAHLAPDSDAIDRGTPLGFSFQGHAHDLGALEFGGFDPPAVESVVPTPAG